MIEKIIKNKTDVRRELSTTPMKDLHLKHDWLISQSGKWVKTFVFVSRVMIVKVFR